MLKRQIPLGIKRFHKIYIERVSCIKDVSQMGKSVMLGDFYKRSKSMGLDEIQANLVYFLDGSRGGSVFQGSTLDRFTHLIDLGGNINTQGKDGQTLLMRAAWYASEGHVSQFIKRYGADVNIQDNEGRTALTHCTKLNSFDVLLNAGADIHHVDKSGMTILLRASDYRGASIVDRLIDLGADIHVTNESTVLINMIPKDSNSSFSSFQASIETLEKLISLGVDIDAQNHKGETALVKAVCHASIPSIKLLLKSGANPFIVNDKGESALDIATQLDFRDSQTVNLLITEAIEARESQGRSAGVSNVFNLSR